MAEADEDLIKLLVCSCNAGNAEPTPDALAAWIPDDGDMTSMLQDTLYPVPSEIVPTDAPTKDLITTGNIPDGPGKLDVIVLGMQEATFEVNSEKPKLKRRDSDAEAALADADGRSASAIAKKKKKKKKNPVRKITTAIANGTRTLTGDRDLTKEVFAVPDLRSTKDKNGGRQKSVMTAFKDTHVLHRLLRERCPSYSAVIDYIRGEMRMIVLIRNDLKDQVTDVEVDTENTGIGGVFANKGGIVSTITLRNTRLAFMSAHLEAHEGGQHYINRNSNLAEILDGARVGHNDKFFDSSVNSHHAFFCGDLNYRVVLPDAKNMQGDQHKEVVRGMVEREEWRALNDGDELAQALTKKECLNGFVTLPCYFPPTFKVLRGDGYQYNEKRTPSYTDRVLWRSADGFEANVSPVCYEPCPDFNTSDHKPVRCAFSIKANKPGNVDVSNTNATKRNLYMVVSNLKCTDLTIMDVEFLGGASDPYVMFITDPKELLWHDKKSKKAGKGWPRTKIIYQNLNPVWKDPLLLEMAGVAEHDDLAGAMLYLTVIDWDRNSGDDVIGAVPLSLQRLCSKISPEDVTGRKSRPTQKTTISTPVLRNGLEQGKLECTIEAAWVTQEEFEGSVASALSSMKKKSSKTCSMM